FVGLFASLAGGILSDRYGRKTLMVGSRAAFLVLAYPVFMLIVGMPSTFTLLLGTAVLSTLLNLSSGPFYAAFIEILPRRVRGGIFATVYAIAIAVFGGTTQPVIAWLIHVTGNPMAPSWYLFAATLLSLVAMYLMAETAPIRLAHDIAAEPGLPPTA
ncbi:MAG TPA: hypothetical protein VJ476_13485, partial [Rhizomicrobium sp.]|nr:hypothetical protein [Rhizomicrobium sp.]